MRKIGESLGPNRTIALETGIARVWMSINILRNLSMVLDSSQGSALIISAYWLFTLRTIHSFHFQVIIYILFFILSFHEFMALLLFSILFFILFMELLLSSIQFFILVLLLFFTLLSMILLSTIPWVIILRAIKWIFLIMIFYCL